MIGLTSHITSWELSSQTLPIISRYFRIFSDNNNHHRKTTPLSVVISVAAVWMQFIGHLAGSWPMLTNVSVTLYDHCDQALVWPLVDTGHHLVAVSGTWNNLNNWIIKQIITLMMFKVNNYDNKFSSISNTIFNQGLISK